MAFVVYRRKLDVEWFELVIGLLLIVAGASFLAGSILYFPKLSPGAAGTRQLDTEGAWLFVGGSIIYTLASLAQLWAVIYELGSTQHAEALLDKPISTEWLGGWLL